ncbi:MAG: sulfotransferase domain-containing protein [Planctomycetes bacterium]|nr:sulfotransferase domain-containing protein [Planctomycetota bacterium]
MADQNNVGEFGRTLRCYMRKLQRHPVFLGWKRPLRAATSSLPNAWRLATQRIRQLPTAVIVGAQKAGTTQLYAYLTTHPRCFKAAEKEVDFFSKHAERSIEWYRSRFPLRRIVAALQGQVLEASPSYLPVPEALHRMKSVLPEARVIVLLRDPVSRAFSHYQHYRARHLEARSFAAAVDDELRQNATPPVRGIALRHGARPMLGYVARGYYALQLELLLSLYSRERVLVMDSAELFADTNAACQRVFSFLGLERYDIRPGKVFNRGYYDERIDPRVAELLRSHYQPYDELLRDLLGVRFSWMIADHLAA